MTVTPALDPIGAGTTVLGWIRIYGIATVFAMVLLAYVLWSSIVVMRSLVPIMERTAALQQQLATSQVAIVGSVASIQSDLARGCAPTR